MSNQNLFTGGKHKERNVKRNLQKYLMNFLTLQDLTKQLGTKKNF